MRRIVNTKQKRAIEFMLDARSRSYFFESTVRRFSATLNSAIRRSGREPR